MLKNVSIASKILEELGFTRVDTGNKKETILRKNNISAQVLANGSVKINDSITDFKAVKRYKIAGI